MSIKKRKPIYVNNCKWLQWFGLYGLVVYPFVFSYFEPYDEEGCSWLSAVVYFHETKHFTDMQEFGVLRWYVDYAKQYLRNRRNGMSRKDAYLMITWEIRARKSSGIVTEFP